MRLSWSRVGERDWPRPLPAIRGEGARAVVVVDRESTAQVVANEIHGVALIADVGVEADIVRVVRSVVDECGAIDLFCSNAGIGGGAGGIEARHADWQRTWQVNVMAHLYAARAVLPGMLARGSGYPLQTASAAGLLTQIGSAPYAVTKHAAVAFAEWLAVTYGDRGIKVSCLCPQGVRTPMLEASVAEPHSRVTRWLRDRSGGGGRCRHRRSR